jgi:hypothetical protein
VLPGGICADVEPPLVEVEPGHLMACHIEIGELRRLQAGDTATATATTAAAAANPPAGGRNLD